MKEEITLQVLTLAMLASKGIKVARLAGNRNFSEKNIKEKKKSLKKMWNAFGSYHHKCQKST